MHDTVLVVGAIYPYSANLSHLKVPIDFMYIRNPHYCSKIAINIKNLNATINSLAVFAK